MSLSEIFGCADFIEIDAFPQHSATSRHTLLLPEPRIQHGFCCILSGTFVYEENDRTLRAAAGDIVYLKQGARYRITSYQSQQPAADILLNFRVGATLDYSNWNEIVAHDATGEITAEFQKLSGLCAREASMLQKKAALYRILCALVPPKQTPDPRLVRVKQLLDDPACLLSDPMLAESVSMSISTLQRRFRTAYGKTLCAYRSFVKISAAKKYLLAGNYAVSEIACLLGYCDTSYFCRQFKKATGLTPHQYIRQKQNY